jgi:WD40 repeat protein
MPGAIVSLAFHPLNATLLAAGSADGTLQLWDTATGELLDSRRDADNMVSAVAFSPDGSWLASAQCERLVYSTLSNLRCTQARIEIWNGGSGRLANPYLSFTGHSDWPTALSFTADSRRLLSGGRDGNVYVWDALAWPPLASPVWNAALTDAQPAAAQGLAYSPDNQVLAIALCLYAGSAGPHCTQGTIVLLEPGGSTPVAEISSPEAGVAKLAFSSASPTRQLATAGCEQVDEVGDCLRSAITLWTINPDWSSSAEILGHVDSAVTALAFAPHASRLAVGGDDGMVSVWDSATKELVFDGVYADSDQVNSVSFSSDGTLLAATGRDGAIMLLDAATGRPLDDPPLQVRGSDSPALAAFRPLTDSLMLASGGFFAHPVTLWDIKRSAGHIATDSHGLSDNSAGIADLSFNGDGSLLASANMAGEFTLWDVEQQRQVGPPLAAGTELQRFNMATVYDIELRPDGRQLATVVSDGDGAATWVLTWDTDPASWRRRACWRASRPELSPFEREQFLGAGAESSILCP